MAPYLRLLLIALLALLNVTVTVDAAAVDSQLARRALVLPQDDPFYDVPADVALYAPGDIIRSRPVPNPLAAFGTVPVNIQGAYQLLYRTTNSKNHATATVTTVIVPHNADFSKLLSYQIEYDASWTGCDPSYVLQQGAPPVRNALGQYSILLYTVALNHGWVVSTPDYEGPNAAFTAGIISGRATLDGVRAALRSEAVTGVRSDAKYAMWGYSGGSLASEWAAELQPGYAPELDFIGTVLGGLVPNVTEVLETTNMGPFAGLIPAGILGLSADYPELEAYINQHLIPGKAAAFRRALSQCLVDDAEEFAFQDIFTYFDTGRDVLQNPIPQGVIRDGGVMGLHGTPRMPIYAYKAVPDEVSVVADTDALIAKLCAQGAQIEYERELLGEHLSEIATGSAGALRFLIDRFDGKPAAPGCSTRTVATEGLDPANLPLYGETIFDDIKTLLGLPIGPASIGSV